MNSGTYMRSMGLRDPHSWAADDDDDDDDSLQASRGMTSTSLIVLQGCAVTNMWPYACCSGA